MLDSADFHSSGGGGGVCWLWQQRRRQLRQRQRWQLRLARQCALNEAHSVISADAQMAHVADRLHRSVTYQNLHCKLPTVCARQMRSIYLRVSCLAAAAASAAALPSVGPLDRMLHNSLPT